MKDVNFKPLLKSTGFMSQVPEEVIGEIIETSGEKLFVKKGQTIIEQGHVNEHLYVVGSGTLSILVDGRQVATVSKGALVGEGSLVAKALASATCQGGADNTLILKIPHSAIVEQLAEVPEVLAYLESESNKRHTQNLSVDLLTQVPAFEDASTELYQELIKTLKFVSYVQGAYLVEAGKADDKGMFLIKSGKVGAYNQKEAFVAEYTKNNYFGESAIFSNINEKRELTMKAEGFVEAFQLSRADFLRVSSKFPEILNKMKNKAVILRRASSQRERGE
jgi:signal-transduction protein with cAMP-binding, CBS, and nucleotidyltransferase domain